MGAEATHILVAAFYIGSERSVMEWKLKMVTIYIVLYSMVSTLGIDVAIYIIPFTIDERNYEPFFAVCRAVGAGALLYVILFGIRDKHEQAPNDIVSWFLGLSLMMLLQICEYRCNVWVEKWL